MPKEEAGPKAGPETGDKDQAKLNKKEQAELLKTVLRENDVELNQLHGKKIALGNVKEDFEKRLDGFKESEKLMTKALEPFNGMQDGRDKREMFFLALDSELNPEKGNKLRAGKGERPEFKLTVEQKEKIFEELDTRLAEARESKGGEPVTKPFDHLAAYVFLQEERIFKAEDQLNGTQEQALGKEDSFLAARGTVYDLFRGKPDFLVSLNGVVNNKGMTAEEKNRAFAGFVAGVDDPKQREALEGYVVALQERDSGDFKHAIELSAGTVRREKENLARIGELSVQEQALAGLAGADVEAGKQKESLARHDINENSGQASV